MKKKPKKGGRRSLAEPTPVWYGAFKQFTGLLFQEVEKEKKPQMVGSGKPQGKHVDIDPWSHESDTSLRVSCRSRGWMSMLVMVVEDRHRPSGDKTNENGGAGNREKGPVR